MRLWRWFTRLFWGKAGTPEEEAASKEVREMRTNIENERLGSDIQSQLGRF
jgi:hypothetical protein